MPQLATSSRIRSLDSPSPESSLAPTIQRSDKPLPSPPIAHISQLSPVKVARCLLDATEKPLRRSPPGKPQQVEDWPALFPEKPTTPNTLREIASQDGPFPLPRSTLDDKERYPALASTSVTSSSVVVRTKPAKKVTFTQPIHRKPVPSSSLPNQSTSTEINKNTDGYGGTLSGEAGAIISATKSDRNSEPDMLPDLSASAAAIQKSANESSIAYPRQTRTSSLRARISAGHLVNDGPSSKTKVVGFADFTTQHETTVNTSKGGSRASVHAPSRSPSPSSRPHVRGSKPPKVPVRANRAPAQMVAGSRRRAAAYRPSSRSSLRDGFRAPSPSTTIPPSSRHAPTISASKQNGSGMNRDVVELKQPVITSPRRSSIPIFRGAVSNLIDQNEDKFTLLERNHETRSHTRAIPRTEFEIFEDPNSSASGEKQDDSTKGVLQEVQGSVSENRGATASQIHQVSPKHGYQIKRLSMTSPEYGPTLRISPSANRFIMGEYSDKENQPSINNKKSKGLPKAIVKKELQKAYNKEAEVDVVFAKPSQRPLSSQGLPHSASRAGLVDVKAREKKVKSVEIAYGLPTDHLRPNSSPQKPHNDLKNVESFTDDPFFDARSRLEEAQADAKSTTAAEDKTQNNPYFRHDDKDSWISPMPKMHGSALRSSVATSGTEDILPVTTQEHPSEETRTRCNVLHEAQAGKEGVVFPEQEISTPKPLVSGSASSKPSVFPPRSSSRTSPLSYTVNESVARTSAPIVDIDENLSKEFLALQHKLGISQDAGSSTSELPNVCSERESIAHESTKSQGSYSKGLVSNFRGLFHKRSSDPSEPSAMKTGKKNKQKASVTHNGSPFPPISEVASLYRPTLASTNRSNAIVGRNETTVNTPTSPSFTSPTPNEVSITTTLAMQILESARHERSSPKKERLLELGKIMVDAITHARDAEKAMEEAKQAARKADVAQALCKKSVGEVARCVRDWKEQMDGAEGR